MWRTNGIAPCLGPPGSFKRLLGGVGQPIESVQARLVNESSGPVFDARAVRSSRSRASRRRNGPQFQKNRPTARGQRVHREAQAFEQHRLPLVLADLIPHHEACESAERGIKQHRGELLGADPLAGRAAHTLAHAESDRPAQRKPEAPARCRVGAPGARLEPADGPERHAYGVGGTGDEYAVRADAGKGAL